MSDVFLLGAGFSKSISANMPTLWDLGELALRDERLAAARREPRLLQAFEISGENGRNHHPVDIERPMTYLAQDQPFLIPEENAQNKATFLGLTDGLATVLREFEGAAADAPPPGFCRSSEGGRSRRQPSRPSTTTRSSSAAFSRFSMRTLSKDRRSASTRTTEPSTRRRRIRRMPDVASPGPRVEARRSRT